MSDHSPISGSTPEASVLSALEAMPLPVLGFGVDQELNYLNPQASALFHIPADRLPLPFSSLPNARLLEEAVHADTGPGAGELLWTLDEQEFLVRYRRGERGGFILLDTPRQPQPESRFDNPTMRRFWATALAGIGSWTWDLASNRLHADSLLGDYLGLNDQRTVRMADMLASVHPEDKPRLDAAIRAAVDSEPSREEVEIEEEFRVQGEPEERWLSMRGGVIRDAKGKPTALCGVHFDITERKRAEESILRAKEALEEANRAKDSFLAKVSHEIRTPLTAILGYAEMMAARSLSPQDRKDVDEIRDNGSYLQSLVDDLLDLSRIIAGKVSVEPEVVDLRHLGHELLSTMNMRAMEKNLGFSLNVSPGVPSQTFSDPVRIRQILSNLIGNAVKFTEQGEVSVRIQPEPGDDQLFVSFEVSDTGPGIDPQHLQEVFEPFAQASEPGSNKSGLGLGLAISQRLAEMLGGTIRARSEPGRGSVFTLLLPAVEVDPLQATATERSEPANAPSPVGELRGRALVVDDVESILGLLRAYLEGAGMQVETARNGVEAMDAIAAASAPFDVILMDLHMPHLAGRETLDRLRAEGHELPIIALTASAMKGERERCLSWGFNDFVSKPFTREQLLVSVARMLAGDTSARREQQVENTSRATLLLVEDHASLAELTARQLEGLGFEVEIAYTGAAAIDRASALLPAAMVLDLSLPDMDGIELCRALRQQPGLQDCRMIAYTGLETPEQHDQAMAAGFHGVLVKPADPAEFAALLKGTSNNS